MAIILRHAFPVGGTTEVEHKRREVRFPDTPHNWLRSNDYVVRERVDLEESERVVKGTNFQIRKNPETLAVCSLTLWYPGKTDGNPVVAELSFQYEDAEEGCSAKMSKRAYDIFMAIQSQLGDWINAKSMTKTAYVYSLAK